MEETKCALAIHRLLGERYGLIRRLYETYGSFQEIWKNFSSWHFSAERERIDWNQLVCLKERVQLERLPVYLEKKEINFTTWLDPDYPEELKNIYSPPLFLYWQGMLPDKNELSIAIVGTRKATSYGKQAAEKFAKGLAQNGVTVVSGMARGIDTCAHQSALTSKGKTIGILGCGIDHIYPPENRKLYEDVVHTGCLLSEYPLGSKPLAHHFPARNRLISGFSKGVLVIEAAEKSGSMITVSHALEQGKDVFAVPGSIFSSLSCGCHRLIKEGAQVADSVADILENYKIETFVEQNNIQLSFLDLNTEEKKLCAVLDVYPQGYDDILRKLPWDAAKLNYLLTSLEIKGVICQIAGKKFYLND